MSRNKNDVNKLFEFWCEIKRSPSTDTSTGAQNKPIILESYPPNYKDVNSKDCEAIINFAYPCDFRESDVIKTYSFVLTMDNSIWRYGFCRHDARTQTAMVMITYLPWHDTFLRLMPILSTMQRSEDGELSRFLTDMYNSGVPAAGSNVKVFYNNKTEYFVFDRPEMFKLPSIPQNHNLNLYYNFVDSKHMIAVFAAMLAERRIIFTSRCLDRLSSCVQAAHAFLYPMVWQHIFIPILPMQMKDYVSAPIPYLIGIHQQILETIYPEETGEVVILDCDNKTFSSPFDDIHDMPSVVLAQMKKQLSKTHEHFGDRISRIFLGALVQFLSGYRDAVEFREPNRVFNFDKFIESRPYYLRSFIAKMSELQIFRQFIDERMELLNKGLGFSDEFEIETVCYAERMRHGNSFLKNVKEKTNPAVKSAVKSVKESSRGVKTAYKDLKSKFRDITPPSSNTHFRSHLASNSQHDGFASGKLAGRHSAPSSPIFSKRSGLGGGASSATAGGFQYASPKAINGATQHVLRSGTSPAIPLSMSSSSSHIQSNGHAGNALTANHRNYHLSSSPTVSPASSMGSSEMNLSQELQNHPLFKSPIVDRSSLRSLQPQHLTVPSLLAQSNKSDSLHSLPPTCESTLEDEATNNDLISLDDSHNNSFDLEDFDPLNQNAKQFPKSMIAIKSTTLPAGTSAPTFMSSSVSNPVYTYFTPQHMRPPLKPPTEKPPPIPTSLPPDEDFELLRKYGLDQFTVTSANSSTTATALEQTMATNGMSNWTTFD